MNTKQIINILTNDFRTRRIFRGVLPRNKLPQFENRRPSVYVINTDHSTGPGQHWVCVFLEPNGKAEYFDSFGLPPTHAAIHGFIVRNSVASYRFNQKLLQSLTSSTCGLYVLYYVFMKSRGASLWRIQQVFDVNNLWANDRRVRSLVQRFIN